MNINKIKEKYCSIAGNGNTKTLTVIILVSAIVAGYIFFFNTTKIIGENFNFETAEIGKIIDLETNHSVRLVRADLDTETNTVEFEFYFQNTNFDGCDDYKIDIKSSTKNGSIAVLDTKTLCTDSDLYVIRGTLPKSWYAIVADITVENSENNTLEAKFYSTEETLYKTKISSETSREHFLQLDMKRNIETFQNNISELNHLNEELEEKIYTIDKSISNLQDRLSYMSADELLDAQQQILSMGSEKNNALTEIDDNNKAIREYQNNISNLENKLKGA